MAKAPTVRKSPEEKAAFWSKVGEATKGLKPGGRAAKRITAAIHAGTHVPKQPVAASIGAMPAGTRDYMSGFNRPGGNPAAPKKSGRVPPGQMSRSGIGHTIRKGLAALGIIKHPTTKRIGELRSEIATKPGQTMDRYESSSALSSHIPSTHTGLAKQNQLARRKAKGYREFAEDALIEIEMDLIV